MRSAGKRISSGPGNGSINRLDAQILPDLWIFSIVAQEGGMAAGGRRLGITQAAVSHRIARLEARLEASLFERRSDGLTLTAMGHRLSEPVLASMAGLDAAIGQFDRSANSVIVINCAPSLAADWLIGASKAWYAVHPDITLDIRADQSDLSRDRFERERIDVAIRYAPESVASLNEIGSFQERLIPVCSPDYLTMVSDPCGADLVLLDDDTPWLNAIPRAEWRQWQGSDGGTWPEAAKSQRRFNVASLTYDAAALAQGIAIGRVVLIAGRVRLSRLVAFKRRSVAGADYRFLCNRVPSSRSASAIFVQWAIENMAATQAETLHVLGVSQGRTP